MNKGIELSWTSVMASLAPSLVNRFYPGMDGRASNHPYMIGRCRDRRSSEMSSPSAVITFFLRGGIFSRLYTRRNALIYLIKIKIMRCALQLHSI